MHLLRQDTKVLQADTKALKQDVGYVMERIGDLEIKMDRDITNLKDELRADMHTLKTELKDHFNLVAENMHYDFLGTFKDRTEDHERRIKHLERKTGIAA